MAELIRPLISPAVHPDQIVAVDVPHEIFLRDYTGEQHLEWVRGTVLSMSRIDPLHDAIAFLLRTLFTAFLERTTGGRVFQDPMLLRLGSINVSRAPDLQVLLPHRFDQIQGNEVIGPVDLVVEIVSKTSQRRDRYEKLGEYEAAGIREYWLFDPLRREQLVYILNAAGMYDLIAPDTDGAYQSQVLPGFRLASEPVWKAETLTLMEMLALVEQMLATPRTP